ncbi:MAG: hypothetical protein WC807_18420 [Hyphomicrobium sp.]
MAEKVTEFVQEVAITDPKTGLPTRTVLQKLNAIIRTLYGTSGTVAGKAGLTQITSGHWLIPEPEDKTYTVIQKAADDFTITEVTTRCTTGTCTVTVQINGTPLGGTANSASSTEQSQSHSSANAVAAGDTVAIVVSSNSSSEMLTVDIAGTMVLAA